MSKGHHFRPRNWEKFQHYKDRRPPWIKFHADLLSDKRIMSLSPARFKVLVTFWIWYSQQEASRVPADSQWIARQLPAISQRETTKALDYLVSNNFIELVSEDASAPLAKCSESAPPENRVQRKKEEAKASSKERAPTRGSRISEDWAPTPDQNSSLKTGKDAFTDEEIERELPRFRDHWIAADGKNAVKRDWLAAFRNWLRKSREFRGRNQTAASGPPQGKRAAGGGLLGAGLRHELRYREMDGGEPSGGDEVAQTEPRDRAEMDRGAADFADSQHALPGPAVERLADGVGSEDSPAEAGRRGCRDEDGYLPPRVIEFPGGCR